NLIAGDTNSVQDVFVRDLAAGTTVRASVSSAGGAADQVSYSPSISADGGRVGFEAWATDLTSRTGVRPHVFVRDLTPGRTTPASVGWSGDRATGSSSEPSISADGTRVAFYSSADNLVPSDHNKRGDVFLRDLPEGTTTRISVDPAGGGADKVSFNPAISA